MAQLDGRVAIVTGGSKGIGLATATALVADGATVVVSGRDEYRLTSARATLERVARTGPNRQSGSPTPTVEAVRSDVRSPDDVQRLIDGTATRYGGLDILVNNAGIGVFSEVVGLTVDRWREVIETNLSGAFYCCRAAIPHLRARGGGWIINVSSLAGRNPFSGGGAYCASKAGLNALSECLMQEVRYDDIRVCHVMPGSVDTDFGGSSQRTTGDWRLRPDDVARVILDLLAHDRRSLPSCVEIRPSKPRR